MYIKKKCWYLYKQTHKNILEKVHNIYQSIQKVKQV